MYAAICKALPVQLILVDKSPTKTLQLADIAWFKEIHIQFVSWLKIAGDSY